MVIYILIQALEIFRNDLVVIALVSFTAPLDSDMYIYRLVLLLFVIIFLLSPGILDWWASSDNAWYSPYFFWFITIFAMLVLQGKHDVDEL